MDKPIPIIPEVLAQRLGLTIEEYKLSLDGEFFGAFFFSDCDIDVYDSTFNPKKVHVKAKTAVIDPDNPTGTLDFTKVHECMHWVLHRKRYLLEKLFNKNACQIKCSLKKKNEKSDTEWLEWQANALAAHVLMPSRQFSRKAHELIESYISMLQPNHEIDILHIVAEELAEFFAVSRTAVIIRMVETGFDEMLGIFNYVDDHYVKPYAFKKGYLQKFQTFSISFQDFVYTCISEPEIGEQIKSGHLIFVESHICINSSKFIFYDENRIPQLTDYARYHMDECCLVFDLSVRNANSNQKRIYDCALCRASNSFISFEAKINRKYSGQVIEDAKVLKEHVDDVRQTAITLPRDFKRCLETLMKWSGVTLEELSERTGIAVRTLSNIKNDPSHNIKIESIVAICLGLRLPPELSFDLIEASGLSFRIINQNEAMYKHILYAPDDWDVRKWNERLLKMNLKPLNDLMVG